MPIPNDEIAHEREPTGAWETLKPRSFNTSVYLPFLKLSVTCGSFILYNNSRRMEQDSPPQVGRILDVVSSIDMVPQSENFPAIQETFQGGGTTTNDMPVQFIKVNIFKNRSLLADRDFPGEDANLLSTTSTSGDTNHGWQFVVQLDEHVWILADAIINLAFVFLEEDVTSHFYDDCQGMCNFFVLKYRLSRNGCVSSVPGLACPPFPGQIEGYNQYWSVDHCQLIFSGIRQIGRAMQRLLCRIAQSQGDFATRNAKLQLPSCSWFYIKNQMALQGIAIYPNVQFSQPQPILSWGLTYRSIRQSGRLEVLRFDTATKMAAFREVFGHTSGYGVRKKRPRYSEPQEFLNMNDVVNIVYFKANENDDDDDDHDSTLNADDDVGRPFQRFGVMNDGIDLLYSENDGILQVVLRYRKLVVTNQSLPFLRNVGVVGLVHHVLGENDTVHAMTTAAIIPGMEFMDDGYVMRITSVTGTAIRARKTYKVVDSRTTILRAVDCNEITYSNVTDVKNRIREMLE